MRIADLRYREVINLHNGHRLGYISDVDMDLGEGRVKALIIPGPARFFGLFGREDDYLLPFDSVSRVGSDIIFVDVAGDYARIKRSKRPII